MENQEVRTGDREFRIGLVGNVALAVLKIVVGGLAGSQSLLADGWHSLADVLTNGGTWIAHRLARRAPDEDHHYGHGKLEAFAGLTVGAILVAAGLSVGWSAFSSSAQLATGWEVWLALGVAVLSILVNVYLTVIASRGARETGSAGLAALARDNGSDALSSLLVVSAILGARFGVSWAEPVVTAAIGVLIVVLGWRSVRDGFDVLMDRADPDVRRLVCEAATAVDEVRGVQTARVRPIGASLVVDMEISVDGALSVRDGHEIAHAVEDAITNAYSHVREVHVHVNPTKEPAVTDPSP